MKRPRRWGLIHRTHEEGGECLPVTRPGEPQGSHDHPSFLADGRHFLFSTSQDATLYVGDMATGDHEVLIARGARNAQFVRPNWVLHSGSPAGGVDARGLLTLVAQRIDLRTHELIGDPGAVFTGIVTPGGAASYSAAQNGILVAVRTLAGPPPPLVWVTRDGVVADTVPQGNGPWTFASSADGGRVALGGWGIWIYDLDRGVWTSGDLSLPAWWAREAPPNSRGSQGQRGAVGFRGRVARIFLSTGTRTHP